ncbi:MAG: hypothetical protein II749_06120 [Clostridia bacterium]|nr:hypothetical protein [Clostridia bacterium]
MIELREIKVPYNAPKEALPAEAARRLGKRPGDIKDIKILKRALDARRGRREVSYVYNLGVSIEDEENVAEVLGLSLVKEVPYIVPEPKREHERPVVVGFGPAGMFCSYVLAKAGLKPIVLERGRPADERKKDVLAFWKTGKLSPESNVQFGEGGAGTFSDGKLTTGTHNSRIKYVLETFRTFGADESICYDSKPHIGTDRLQEIVVNIRHKIESLGGEVRFSSRLSGIEMSEGKVTGIKVEGPEGKYDLPCEELVLAIGHSARDTFRMLLDTGLTMEPKPFSMGVRIEHRQADLDEVQHRGKKEGLPASDYKLSARFDDGSSAYTFCMCPGGYVVASSSEEGGVVTNGMSYSKRDGENANAAVLVTLTPDMFPYDGPLGGVIWQREIEHAAFVLGGEDYRAPAQLAGDFLKRKGSRGPGKIVPTYKPGVRFTDLHRCLPKVITDTLEKAIPAFAKKIGIFSQYDAVLTAPETRSSSPVRIIRDEMLESSVRGIYPCGEGAGYAGGIVSSAVDGIRIAEAIIES